MRDAADNTLKSFHLGEEEQKTYATVKGKFYEFNQHCQEERETFHNFVTALYGLVEHCKYGKLQSEIEL